ncbi:hypothetical protein IWW34DRAFT_770666 [Fusarium oxysporum f. sp. albedinis]|nr:hypothetical protein IWW34DRAFT_770666 [Fusarium oxysporum f. sp. albedinis]
MMERYSEDSESSFGDLSRQDAGKKDAGKRDADGGHLLPVGEPRHPDGLWSLISREALDSNPSCNTSDPQSGRIYRRACRKSLDFQMEQYLRYLSKVRAARIEPKDLVHGPGIAENGPNAPPSDFWCLIVVRDRLVSQSKTLCQHIGVEQQEARESLSDSSLYCGVLACISGLKIRSGSAAVLSQDKWFIPGILVAVAVPLSYLAPKTVKVIATDRCERILQSIIRRATNWDLDQEGREKLESLAYWLQMVL